LKKKLKFLIAEKKMSASSLVNYLFYDDSNQSSAIRHIKTLTITSPFIYCPQDVRNLLWVDCVVYRKSFRECYEMHECNLKVMIEQGLNKNFFTRDRWLDIHFISSTLKLSLDEFLAKFEIDKKQYRDWKLRRFEKKEWRNTVTTTSK
jgi:hypothetical protein